jgi:hypothetical protein
VSDKAEKSVLALAGRRTDPRRFPSENESGVRDALKDVLLRESVRFLVSSAARGADILAIEAAHALGIPNRIILPFEKAKFREKSVADGTDADGAKWGQRYDAVAREADERRQLIIIASVPSMSPYRAVTHEIVQQAKKLAAEQDARFLALAVWDGKSRGDDDHTAGFLEIAEKAEATILPLINTLNPL